MVLVLLGVESLPVLRLSLGRVGFERGEVGVHEERDGDTVEKAGNEGAIREVRKPQAKRKPTSPMMNK
jgi:hypothetical protein